MADIFGNIFEDEKKKDSGITVQSSKTNSQSGQLFGDIFGDEGKSAKQSQVDSATSNLVSSTETKEKKGFFAKAANAGKSVIKWGLDVFNKQTQKNNQATLQMVNLQRSAPLQAALKGAKTEEEKQAILNNPKYAKYKPYASYEEYQKDIPLIKFFNSDTGKKVVGGISEKTSNIPLKTVARIKSIGSQTYDEAYNAILAERNDPTNPTWQKFLYELQDTGIQSGIGILLSVGTAAVTRNPNAGYAISGAYYTALSADEQLQNKGEVDSLGNIAIDVIGDQIINRTLVGVLGNGSKSTIRAALEGFGIEGSTEVIQSLAKYANDYGNATTQEEKDAVLAEASNYVKSGAIAMEFAVGGTVGAVADVTVSSLSGGSSAQPNDATTKKGGTPKTEAPEDVRVPNTSPVQATIENADIDSAATQLVSLEQTGDMSDPIVAAEITALRDVLNDYTTAFGEKTVYVPSDVSSSPLVEIATTKLPNGKVVVKFSANTEANGIASTYDFGQLFSSQEEATKSAKEAIIAWAQTQETTDPQEKAQLEKIIDYTNNPRSPIKEGIDRGVAVQEGNFTEEEVQKLALYTNKLGLQNANAGVTSFNDGDVIDFNGKKWRILSQFDTEGDTKYRLLPLDAREQIDAKKKKKSDKKTQKDIVEDAVKDKPKTIQEVAEETGILEPNVRRILGVGAKEGTFTRVEKGVYVLSKDGIDTAYIYPEDAIETLPKLAAEGFKADMIFLDIPYDTPAVRGGNRGVKYNLISVDQFKTIVDAVSQITKNDDTPVLHMFSQAKSGLKKMEQYNKVLVDAGFKPIARGDYTKLQKDGVTRVRNMRGAIIEPEGLLLFTKSGNFEKENPNLNFTLVRPKGYQTEKPAEMLKALIEMTTKEGDVVLDPFAGSGVTGAEAVKSGRKAVLIEKDKTVVEKFTKPRLEEAVSKTKNTKKKSNKDAKYTPIKEVNGQKVSQRTSKTIYKKGAKMGKGTYKGKTYSTNTFILEFSDVDFKENTKTEDMPNSDAIDTVINNIGKTKLGKPLRTINHIGNDIAVVLKAGDGEIAFGLDFYNYLIAKYPTAEWVGDHQRPTGLYEGKKLVALAMPINDTSGKVLENYEKKEKQKGGAPSGLAQMVFSEGDLEKGGKPEKEVAKVPITLGQLDSINPIEMPELVDIARQLMGNVPQVTKLRGGKGGGTKLGDFMPAAGGRIRLQDFLFKQDNLPEAAKVLAHEMGHLIDYLPDQNIARGNLLGRLASLRGFMQTTFSFNEGKGLPEKARNELRKQARAEVAKQTGKKQQDFTLADKRAVSNLYKKKLADAIKSGGYIRDAKVKKELLTLTRWWHPYDPTKVPESYNKYRESSVELYAEAISVLFNAPKRLQDMAPTFYNAFFEGLDAKPDVRDAYFEVQSLLSGDRDVLVQKRREGTKKMFKDGDYKAIELHNKRVEEKENRRKQYWSQFKHTVIDKNYQIIDRVKKAKKEGKTINPDENPEYFLEERNYLGGKIKALFEREFNTIYSTLNENEITWDDFGELLFYERIAAGDRSDVANPRGITPDAAKELIENIKKQYGAERWAIMQSQTEKFRNASKKVTEEAFEAGLYKPELYQQMQENPAYVTFQVLDHLEDGMTSRVYKSLGTLKDITNPADATMLKVITTLRAAERNKTTKATVDFLKNNFGDEIIEANYTSSPKGRFPMPSKKPNQELVTFFEQGKIKGYYVDPYIAETINNQSVGANAPIVPVIRFMNSTLFRPLFISFNLGFQSFNLIRDFVRFYKNTPNMTFLRAMKRYGQAGRIARIRAFGLPKNASQKDIEAYNYLNKLEEEKVLSVTFNDIISGRTELDKQVEKILADTGIKEFQPKPTIEKLPKFAKPAAKLLNKAGILDVASNMLGFIENLGNLIETLPKAAGVFELASDGELSTEDKSFIRRKIGSPDFLAGGTYKPITNEVFLFSNAIIQGIRSDIEVATDPKTRSGWWWKTAKIAFLPKLLMMAVLYGALGDEYKELMEGASEYDRTNYTIIPLGRDSNGKPIYFRVPVDETSRFLGGMFWKTLTFGQNEKSFGSDLMDVMSYTGGQIPSISPAIESISATTQFLSGQNPYDFFRGRPALSETTFKAGGVDATKAFLGWQFQQLGGGIFYRFYHEPSAQREEGNVEKFFNAPVIGNVLGRFVRVSDYGEVEQLKAIEAKVEKEKAKETIQEREVINKYIKEARADGKTKTTMVLENKLVKEVFNGVPMTKDDQAKAKRLVKKFRLSLQRGNADPNVTALVDASSNDVKLEILKKIQSEMTAKEFSTLRQQLLESGIVSGSVFNDLINQK